MVLIRHNRGPKKDPRWELVSEGYSLLLTTAQLASPIRLRNVVRRQRLKYAEHMFDFVGAFEPMTKPMPFRDWNTLLNELLAGCRTVQEQ